MKRVFLTLIIGFIFVTIDYAKAEPVPGIWSNATLGVTDFNGVGKITSLRGGSFDVGDVSYANSIGNYWSIIGTIRATNSVGEFINNGDGTGYSKTSNTRTGGSATFRGDTIWGQERGTTYTSAFHQSAYSGTSFYTFVDENWIFNYSVGTTISSGQFNNSSFTYSISTSVYVGNLQWDANKNVNTVDVQYNNVQFVVEVGEEINRTPSSPTLSFPSDGSIDVSLTPTLTTNAFSDPDAGDTHLQSDWQISTSSDFSSNALFESSTTHLTSLRVPGFVLQDNTTYYLEGKVLRQ